MTDDSPRKAGAYRLKKAYHNAEFMDSPDARTIRVLCEFVEPAVRFRNHGIRSTVVFFGSTRVLPPEDAAQRLRAAEQAAQASRQRRSQRGDARGAPARPLDAARGGADASATLEAARRDEQMSRYYRDAMDLAKRVTEWSAAQRNPHRKVTVCTGGGPGIMEAANRGAAAAGGKSIGLNISLPLEQVPNAYQTPELAMEFHYFFIRKFWFFYLARALVVFPGGFGTMDELFELLTLVQTHKSRKYMPILIYGREYWDDVIDFQALVRRGTISPEDLLLFQFVDNVDTAFEFLRKELSNAIRPAPH
jgi:uncharacterized protein (TIGR00730 family)